MAVVFADTGGYRLCMMHPFIEPFVKRALDAPAEDGRRQIKMLVHDLARVRLALEKGECPELAVRRGSIGDTHFEADLADGTVVRADAVDDAAQDAVNGLGAFYARDLRVFRGKERLVGTPDGVADLRRTGTVDEEYFGLRFGDTDTAITESVFNSLVESGVAEEAQDAAMFRPGWDN